MSNNIPNLFIVGAPKCGTTTLHNWISEHPDIFMSKNKEPRYYCNFDREKFSGPESEKFIHNLVTDESSYRKLFSGAHSEKWLGESSTDYLWVNSVPNLIRSSLPKDKEIKIIIILRDPVGRAYSEHSHLVRDGLENLSFIESLEAEGERISHGWQPLFYHKARGLYSAAVARYLEIFGPDAVKISFYDDLVKCPSEFLDSVFEFLNIDKIFVNTSQSFNKSGIPISKSFHGFMRKDTFLKKVANSFVGPRFRRNIKNFMVNFNLRPSKISFEEWEYAFRIFQDDINILEELLAVDLKRWKKFK